LFPPEHLSYEAIRKRADEFLARHHPTGEIPVPIEEIVDLKLRMDIIPIPGLRFSHDIDGFTSSDLKAISVDDQAASNYPCRYRFTLAHELGHVVLHAPLYEEHSFSAISEWKDFVAGIPEVEYGWLEYQANAFAAWYSFPTIAFG